MNTKVTKISRWVLGFLYFASGLAGLLGLAKPQPMPELATAFMGGMMAAPYFFPLLKLTETIAGALVLFGVAAPVGLVILAPITVQIFFFHAYLTPGLGNVVVPLVICILHALAASAFWPLYRPLFGCGQCCKTKDCKKSE